MLVEYLIINLQVKITIAFLDNYNWSFSGKVRKTNKPINQVHLIKIISIYVRF